MPRKKLEFHNDFGEQTFVNQTQLARKFGVSVTAISRWTKKGFLPQATILPHGRKAWRVRDIEAWFNSLPKRGG